MPVWASITKPTAESRLTGVGDVALVDICEKWVNNRHGVDNLSETLTLESRRVPDTNEEVLVMT